MGEKDILTEMNYEFNNFFDVVALPTFISDFEGKIKDKTEPMTLLTECFTFICDKINAIT